MMEVAGTIGALMMVVVIVGAGVVLVVEGVPIVREMWQEDRKAFIVFLLLITWLTVAITLIAIAKEAGG